MEEAFVQEQPRVWRCIICGEIYIGPDPPARCPFCGAYKTLNLGLRVFEQKSGLNALGARCESEKLKGIIIETLLAEHEDAERYARLASLYDAHMAEHALFTRLATVEREHAEVFVRETKFDPALAPPRVTLGGATAAEAVVAGVRVMIEREKGAAKTYLKYAETAESKACERLGEVWRAFAEVEEDHMALLQQHFHDLLTK